MLHSITCRVRVHPSPQLEMLRDADRRVAEIVTLCSAHATGHHITLLSLRLNLEPVRSILNTRRILPRLNLRI